MFIPMPGWSRWGGRRDSCACRIGRPQKIGQKVHPFYLVPFERGIGKIGLHAGRYDEAEWGGMGELRIREGFEPDRNRRVG